MKTVDIPAVGERFGSLVSSGDFEIINGRKMTVCACDCGGRKVAKPSDLRRGAVSSCGCAARRVLLERNQRLATHRMSNTNEHKIWRGIIARTTYPKDKYYPRYGGRGITLAERWLVFENFYADMGPRPSSKHSIEREDNNGPYSPDNCKWATSTEQNRNKRSNHTLAIGGVTRTVSEWAELCGIPASKVFSRLRRGFSATDALSNVNYKSTARPGTEQQRHTQRVTAGYAAARKRWGYERRNIQVGAKKTA